MIINFNVERLNKLLYDFYSITGLTVSIWDSNLRMLGHQPKYMSSFCRKIREYPEGAQRCYLSDMAVCLKCKGTGKPETHVCHAGLIDSVVPIKFKEEILGYIMFGQAAPENKENAYKRIENLSRELGIDYNNLVMLFKELDTYDKQKLNAASNILKMSTRYLWLSEYIEIKRDGYATLIENYVKNNISSEISVPALCQKLGISKNRMYKISHESFGMAIGEYVADTRINEAKRLLAATDLPIGKICEAVGIRDYNYFSKFFKKRTGSSPSKYRKNMPLNSIDKSLGL